jgi:hypothetical protein
MGPFEMVVLIVAIVTVASIIKARYGIRTDAQGNEYRVNDGETLKLRDEVKQLKERIHVLERIATDREHSLAQEIESLRDR